MSRLPRPNAVVIAAIAAFLVLGFGLFSAPGHDDSHITYWAAHALQKLGGILNYNGDRVEQSSSLAHVVLLALLGAVTGVPMPTLGPLTSIAAGVAAIALTAQLARLVAPGAPRGAELLVGTASWFVYWGFGGLESTLVAAAAAWLVIEAAGYLAAPDRRGLLRATGAAALYLTARPESPHVLACVLAVGLVYAALRRRQADPAGGLLAGFRAELSLCAVAATLALALFVFRRAYFGTFFPNPVYSKAVELDPSAGLSYLWANLYPAGLWLAAGIPLGLYIIVRDAFGEEPRHAAVLSGALCVAYVSFIVLTGGDWMTGGRFLAHALPGLVAVALLGFHGAIEGVLRTGAKRGAPARAWTAGVIAVIVAVNLYGTVHLADTRSSGRPIWSTFGLRAALAARIGDRGYTWFELANKAHLRDTPVAATLVDAIRELRAHHPDRPIVVMSSQAGMTAYHVFVEHYGAARFIDTISLSTRDFLRCLPPEDLSRRRIGMQLLFDRYFARQNAINTRCGTRRPDIVFDLSSRGVEALLQKNGYTVVYQQRGAIQNEGLGERWLRPTVASNAFVAIDTALIAGTALEGQHRTWVWDIP